MKQVGKEAPDASVSPLAQYLLDCFWRASGERQNYGLGPCRLTSADIVAWGMARGVVFEEWELDAIQAMDGVFLREVGKRAKHG